MSLAVLLFEAGVSQWSEDDVSCTCPVSEYNSGAHTDNHAYRPRTTETPVVWRYRLRLSYELSTLPPTLFN